MPASDKASQITNTYAVMKLVVKTACIGVPTGDCLLVLTNANLATSYCCKTLIFRAVDDREVL